MRDAVYKKTKEAYNRLGRKYLIDTKNLFPRERLPFARSFLKGAHILDVGCGGGRDAGFFTKKGLQITGIDVSDVLIKEARKEVPGAKFICADTLEATFPNNTFDGIWAQAVLLHLKRRDAQRAIKKFHKILKPGGLLHIRVKKGRGEELLSEKLSGWSPRFYTYFSKKEMERMVKKQGFRIEFSKILPDELKRMHTTWIAIWARK